MSKRSSSRHHTSHESKSQKFWKSFLAFVLFLSIAATSLFASARLVFVSPKSIVNMFCSENYIIALQNDIKNYAHDLCKLSAIPADSIDSEITFDTVYDIENAYVSGSISESEQFTSTTYTDYITALGESVAEAADAAVEKYGIETEDSVSDGAVSFADSFTSYVQKRVEFPFMEQLQTIVSIGRTASFIALIVFAVISVLLALIVTSIGTKTYRSLRELAYAFTAASLLDLSLVGGVKLIGCFKSLVLYPTYLADAVMGYINNCLLTVTLAALILAAAALVVITVIWKIKRDDNA